MSGFAADPCRNNLIGGCPCFSSCFSALPDLGGREPEYPWVLAAMGLILRQAPVGVERIAAQTGLPAERANAMVLALWAGGSRHTYPVAIPGFLFI
jgi:hypothetical protein